MEQPRGPRGRGRGGGGDRPRGREDFARPPHHHHHSHHHGSGEGEDRHHRGASRPHGGLEGHNTGRGHHYHDRSGDRHEGHHGGGGRGHHNHDRDGERGERHEGHHQAERHDGHHDGHHQAERHDGHHGRRGHHNHDRSGDRHEGHHGGHHQAERHDGHHGGHHQAERHDGHHGGGGRGHHDDRGGERHEGHHGGRGHHHHDRGGDRGSHGFRGRGGFDRAASPGDRERGHGRGDAQEQRTTVLVLGAGFMGAAIAGELARRGCVVYVYDRDPLLAHNVPLAARKGYLETGREGGLASLYSKKEEEPLMSQADLAHSIGRIHPCEHAELDTFLHALPPIQFVFEAIVEDLRVKQGVMQHLDRHFAAQPDVVFCSNTINFNIDALSATMTHHRERVVGVRFLAPVYYIPRVEVSVGRDFSGTRAFLSVWHALVWLGFAPFLFHFAPGAPRVKLGSDDVKRLLDSYKAAFENAPKGLEKQECRYAARCAFVNDRLHRKLYTHSEKPLVPCRFGGLCSMMDDEHRQRTEHPQPCGYGTCTKLHDYSHRTLYTHPPVACRYGARCREIFDAEHKLLFQHPTRLPHSAATRVGHGHGHGPVIEAPDQPPQPQPAQGAVDTPAPLPQPAEAAAAEAEEAGAAGEDEAEAEGEDDGGNECIICFDATKDALLYPCGHVALCQPCGDRIKEERGGCPICRAPIVGVVKMFFA